jgi:hypothetical protein
MYLSIKTKAKKIICLFRVTLSWKIGYVGRQFHFIFQKHFTFIKWGAFLDFNSAWPKILIKCVTVGNKIMVGRETLNSHIIILGTNVRGFCDNSFFETGPELQISCVFVFFYAMKTSKNACMIRSECTHYAYICLCKQTFQIRSVLVQSCT